MAGCALIRRTDRPTDKEQTCGQEDAAATVDFGLGFVPIRSDNGDEIIAVLIGQQEGAGRWRAAGHAGRSMKECGDTEGNLSVDQRRGRAVIMQVEVALMCPTGFFLIFFNFQITYSTYFFPTLFFFL